MSSLIDNSEITGHVLIVTLPAPGHWMTQLVFAVKLIKRRPKTIITILTAGNHCERMQHALDAYFTGEDARLKDNIRVIKTGGESSARWEPLYLVSLQTYGPYLESLMSSSEIVCTTGKTYPGIKTPNCLIVDFFFDPIMDMTRSICQPNNTPIYIWYSGSTASLLRFKSKDVGGFGDVATEAPILAKQLNKSVEEVSYHMYYPSKGEICTLSGVPPMYDYEYHAERPPLEVAVPVIQVGNGLHRIVRSCDGVFVISDDGFEPEANQVLRDWFAETNKKVYLMGPLIPVEHKSEVVVSEVSTFLSKMQEHHGDRSVIYISFGTAFMPQGPGLVKILEIFLDMNIPLIYSFANSGSLPDSIVERMSQSDNVYTSPWLPQRLILSHSVTAVFMSHGGQNSFTEAVSACVPLIVYPVTVDQPIVASLVSLKFKVGYELLETRTGEALRPAYRGVHPTGTLEAIEREIRDVIVKALGPDGEEKRRNMRLLRDKRNASWDENGSSRRDFERFIRENFP